MKVRRATIPKSTDGKALRAGNYILTIGESGRAAAIPLSEEENRELAHIIGRS